jgi:hypothetical protein
MEQHTVFHAGHAAVGLHAKNNAFGGSIIVDGFQGGDHLVEAFAENQTVGSKSGENTQILQAQFGGDVDNGFDFDDLFPDIIAGEIVSGTAAFQLYAIFGESGFDGFDLRIGATDLQNIFAVVCNGEFQQVETEFTGHRQLTFEGLFTESPCCQTVTHQQFLQSKRTLKHSGPFSD